MSGLFKPHLDILPPAQQKLWPELAQSSKLGFVLYGGTALALRLGHRESVDFDFFSEAPLNREALYSAFPFLSKSQVIQDKGDTFSVLVPYGDSEHSHVKVSFFGSIDFGRVGIPDETEDHVLRVASIEDIMATKLKVILQRAEVKDYKDIATMLNSGASLSHGLASAKMLFGHGFQPSESLKALTYFNDGDLRKLSDIDKKILLHAVKNVQDLPVITLASKDLTASEGDVNKFKLCNESLSKIATHGEISKPK